MVAILHRTEGRVESPPGKEDSRVRPELRVKEAWEAPVAPPDLKRLKAEPQARLD
jgi:hypothetical protein